MKRLIMCEGPNELVIVNILLENEALIFTEDDLLGLTGLSRQADSDKYSGKGCLKHIPRQ